MVSAFVRRILSFAAIGLGIAILVSLNTTPLYQAQVGVLIGDTYRQNVGNTLSEDLQTLISRTRPGLAPTEVDLMKQQTVLAEAIFLTTGDRVGEGPVSVAEFTELYRRYTVEARSGDNAATLSNFALIQISHRDIDFVRDLADRIPQAYDQIRRRTARAGVQQAIARLDAEIPVIKEQLNQLSAQKTAELNRRGLANPEAEIGNILAYRTTLQQQYDSAVSGLASIERQIASQQAALAALPSEIISSQGESLNPLVDQYVTQIDTLQAQRAQLLTQYFDDAPQVQRIDSSIAELQAKLAEQREATSRQSSTITSPNPTRQAIESAFEQNKIGRDGLRVQVNQLRTQLNEQQQLARNLPASIEAVTSIDREIRVLENKYSQLLFQKSELETQEGVVAYNSIGSYVDPEPIEPNWVRNIGIGLLAGICLGLLYSFVIESLNPRVYSANQVAQYLAAPVAATLPNLRNEARLVKQLAAPNARPAESFRYLVSATMLGAPELKQSVVITGIGRNSGSTVCAINYALAMAQAGRRVLLVDTYGRGNLAPSFNIEKKAGITDVLAQDTLAEGTALPIYDSEHPNLKLMPLGNREGARITDYPLERLVSFIDAARDDADVIVFDAAPCDLVADTARLTACVDRVMLVFSAKKTSLTRIAAANDLLRGAGAKEIEVVMTNSTDPSEPFYRANTAYARG